MKTISLKNKVFKQLMIGLSLTTTMITQSMAIGIEPVTNWNLYPIPQEVASISRGGLTTDKVAIQDGIGAILLYGTSGGQTQTNNASFNQLLNSNVNNLNDTNPTLSGLILNNVITVPSNTLNDINNNIFVGGTATYLHTNGTACDDGNATTTGETWLNDVCQGGVAPTLTCADGLIEENGVCYQELATEVCGTDGSGTYNSTTHMCEGTSLIFTQLKLGWNHTCALDNLGDWYCWGRNIEGQLGLGYTTTSSPFGITTPQKLSKKFTQLELGANHTCGIDSVGDTYCWGANAKGQLGLGDTTNRTTPQKLSKQFTQLKLGNAHTCGIDSIGDTWCWGYNYNGQLGLGTSDNNPNPNPIKVTSIKFKNLYVGNSHTCGIKQGTEDTYCWGLNDYGQLGIGNITNQSLPINTNWNKKFSKLSLGIYHTCGIDSLGDTYCWGVNNNGELGLGYTTTSSPFGITTPQKVNTSLKFTQLKIGYRHTCGIEQGTGDTYCWGINNYGQLGINTNSGTNNANLTPQKVSGTFTQIELGHSHTCGIDSIGVTYCWGTNQLGQLGINTNSGTTNPNPTPQKIIGTTSYEKTCEVGFELETTTGRCWQDKQ